MFRTKDATFFFDYLPPSLCFADGDPPAEGGNAAGGDPAPVATEAVEGKDAPGEGTEPKEDNKPQPGQWAQKRINELTAEKHEERRRRETIESEAAVLRAQLEAAQRNGEPSRDGDAPPKPASKPLTESEIDRLVEERVRVRTLNEAANRTAAEGAKAFEDFGETRQALLAAYGDVIQRRPDFVEAITEIPNGHEVFYRLGKDLDLAGQVLGLSPARMAVRLAHLATEAKSEKPRAPALSNAPTPIKTVDGAARANEPSVYDAGSNKVDIKAWIKLRDKEERDAKIAKYGKAS